MRPTFIRLDSVTVRDKQNVYIEVGGFLGNFNHSGLTRPNSYLGSSREGVKKPILICTGLKR